MTRTLSALIIASLALVGCKAKVHITSCNTPTRYFYPESIQKDVTAYEAAVMAATFRQGGCLEDYPDWVQAIIVRNTSLEHSERYK